LTQDRHRKSEQGGDSTTREAQDERQRERTRGEHPGGERRGDERERKRIEERSTRNRVHDFLSACEKVVKALISAVVGNFDAFKESFGRPIAEPVSDSVGGGWRPARALLRALTEGLADSLMFMEGF